MLSSRHLQFALRATVIAAALLLFLANVALGWGFTTPGEIRNLGLYALLLALGGQYLHVAPRTPERGNRIYLGKPSTLSAAVFGLPLACLIVVNGYVAYVDLSGHRQGLAVTSPASASR
jgi:hypothetical protein